MFPHACYLGFTGMPLLKKEKNNFTKFGELVDVTVPAVNQHLKRIYSDNELTREATIINPANKTRNYDIKSLYCEHGKNRYQTTL